MGIIKLIRPGWDSIQPDSCHLIYFTSKIWSWNAPWAEQIPEKAIWILLTWEALHTLNHLCNLDGPLAFEREGHVFPVKDKPRTLTSIIKDSSTAWLSEGRSHQLTTWFVADASRNSQQFCMLVIKQVTKAGTGSWEQSWAGKTLGPVCLHSPILPSPTEIWAAATVQNTLLAEK